MAAEAGGVIRRQDQAKHVGALTLKIFLYPHLHVDHPLADRLAPLQVLGVDGDPVRDTDLLPVPNASCVYYQGRIVYWLVQGQENRVSEHLDDDALSGLGKVRRATRRLADGLSQRTNGLQHPWPGGKIALRSSPRVISSSGGPSRVGNLSPSMSYSK